MMNKLVFIIAIAILSSTVYCQTAPDWIWVKQAGGTSNDYGEAVATDSGGNSYVAGDFRGTATFGAITLTSIGDSLDMYITKLDTNGNYLWAKQAGGTGYDECLGIATDISGNIYVSGLFRGTATFGTTELFSTGQFDIFVAKMNTNGDWLWIKQAGGTYADGCSDIITDSSGNIYVTGWFRGTANIGTTTLVSRGDADAFVAKLESNGNWLWVKQAGGLYSDFGRAIAIDNSGNIYITGNCVDATFDNIILTSCGLEDIFITKVDTNGNYQWVRQAGGTDFDNGDRIVADCRGNIYVSGDFTGTATFGNTTFYNNEYSSHSFIAKLDFNGNWLWVKQAFITINDQSFVIALDNSGNIYVSGKFYGSTNFGTITCISIGASDLFFAKMDADGNYLWAIQAGGTGDWEGSGGITTDSIGNCFVTGFFHGTITFGTTTLTNSGQSDIFIAKLASDGTAVDDELVPEAGNSHLGNAYPNPFQRDANCIIKAEIPVRETGELSIYNLRGQVVESHPLTSGEHEISFSGKDLAPGIYYYRLKTPTINEVKKLILLH